MEPISKITTGENAKEGLQKYIRWIQDLAKNGATHGLTKMELIGTLLVMMGSVMDTLVQIIELLEEHECVDCKGSLPSS